MNPFQHHEIDHSPNYYDDTADALVKRIYATDFEHFGYDPDLTPR